MILKGTDFQVKVWKCLRKIKKGQVKTYKEVVEQRIAGNGINEIGLFFIINVV